MRMAAPKPPTLHKKTPQDLAPDTTLAKLVDAIPLTLPLLFLGEKFFLTAAIKGSLIKSAASVGNQNFSISKHLT